MSKDILAFGELSVIEKLKNIVRRRAACSFGCPVLAGMPLLEGVSKGFYFSQYNWQLIFGVYSRMGFM